MAVYISFEGSGSWETLSGWSAGLSIFSTLYICRIFLLSTCVNFVINLRQLCYQPASNLLSTCVNFVINRRQLCYQPASNLLSTCVNFVINLCQLCYQPASTLLSTCVNFVLLADCWLEPAKRDICKQCRPRSDAAERGVWSGSPLFANSSTIFLHWNI